MMKVNNILNLSYIGRRMSECEKIREKYPDRIPIIIEKNEKDRFLPDIDQNK